MYRELVARPLVKADLARLSEPKRIPTITRIKDSHHFIAKLFAAGMDTVQVAQHIGYPYSRVRMIRASPAFEELIQDYRKQVDQQWLANLDAYFDVTTSNMMRAELQLADRLAQAEDNDDEALPVRDLIAISRDAADRFGYGKKQTNVNVNADFASLLEKAIQRSGKSVDGFKQIEGGCSPVPTTHPPAEASVGPQPGHDASSPSGVVAPFIRRRV